MQRFSILRQLGVLAALGCSALASQALVVPWYTSLDEAQAGQLPGGTSNPGDLGLPLSSGSGSGFGTYDTDTNVLTWNFTIEGLSSPATAAHFHFGAPGVFRGPVRVEAPTLDIGALANQTAGSFSGLQDFDEVGFALPTGGIEQLESELLSGNWYINIHTVAFRAGEIRGQILIPEPAALSLVGLALLAGFAASRRRS